MRQHNANFWRFLAFLPDFSPNFRGYLFIKGTISRLLSIDTACPLNTLHQVLIWIFRQLRTCFHQLQNEGADIPALCNTNFLEFPLTIRRNTFRPFFVISVNKEKLRGKYGAIFPSFSDPLYCRNNLTLHLLGQQLYRFSVHYNVIKSEKISCQHFHVYHR